MKVKRLSLTSVQLVATGSYTTLYTVPDGNDALITAKACNDTSTSVNFTLYKVPSGGSPGVGNLVVNSHQLTDKETYPIRELDGNTLGPGDTLQGSASVAAQVTITGGVVLISRAQGA